VLGAFDAIVVAQSAPGAPKVLCSTQSITARQLRDVATQYLSQHPAERQSSAISILSVAFGQAFPCSK
jgi:hypothetical protein